MPVPIARSASDSTGPNRRRRWRPSAAARTSFSTTVGMPSRASRRGPSGRSCQSRLTARVTCSALAVDAAGNADAERRDVVRRGRSPRPARWRRATRSRPRLDPGSPRPWAPRSAPTDACRPPVAHEDRGLRAADVDADDEVAAHPRRAHAQPPRARAPRSGGAPTRPSPTRSPIGAASSIGHVLRQQAERALGGPRPGPPRATARRGWRRCRGARPARCRGRRSCPRRPGRGTGRRRRRSRRAPSSPRRDARPRTSLEVRPSPRASRGGAPSMDVGISAASLGRAARGSPASWRRSRGSRTGRSDTRRRRPRPSIWPISPAPNPSPWNSSPPSTTPAPDPEPDLDRDEVRRRPPAAEELDGEGRGARCRWPPGPGRRSRSRRISPRGRSCQSRLTAQRMRARRRRRRCPASRRRSRAGSRRRLALTARRPARGRPASALLAVEADPPAPLDRSSRIWPRRSTQRADGTRSRRGRGR